MPSSESPSSTVRTKTVRRSTFNPYAFLRSRHSTTDDRPLTDTNEEEDVQERRRAKSQDSRRRSEEYTESVGVNGGESFGGTLPRSRHARHKEIEIPTGFSLLRFRNASEPQLAARAREQAAQEAPPPVPALPSVPLEDLTEPIGADVNDDLTQSRSVPAIITTVPTMEGSQEKSEGQTLKRSRSRFHPFNRQKQQQTSVVEDKSPSPRPSSERVREKAERRKSRFGSLRPARSDRLDDLRKLAGSRGSDDQPSVHGNSNVETSAEPLFRNSESSSANLQKDSDPLHLHSGSASLDQPRPLQSHSSFAWLPRKKQNRTSLFPLPVKLHPASQGVHSEDNHRPITPRASIGARSAHSPDHSPINPSPLQYTQSQFPSIDDDPAAIGTSALAASSVSFAAPGTTSLLRTHSTQSARSAGSSPNMKLDMRRKARIRSSTWGSGGDLSDEAPPTPPFAVNGSGRNSMSTTGRSSFSNLFVLNRLRHSSDPHSPRQSSQSHGMSMTSPDCSHTNSLNLTRELPTLPEREDGETAMQYLSRVEQVVHKSQIPTLVAKTHDEFLHTVMRSFMRKFSFFGDPLDMAIRKILMEVDLPKETQQIDRVLQSFADRYHECNPGIFASSENAYFIAFSILILQTDVFNKNNKRKMSKPDYIKNTTIEGVSEDALDCFYDNIVYTPFIRVEDDEEMKKKKSKRKHKKAAKAVKAAVLPDGAAKASKEPLDPYLLIFEDKLDILRPPIKDVIGLDDPYSYLGATASLDRNSLRSNKAGILQIESARSRPDAFLSPSGIENPNDAKAGIVELPVDKVGVLWRKDPKKKTARSPWQEWGAVLCGAGLYFFKNAGWVKSLIHQYETHLKHGHYDTPVTFKPAIQTFKPDYMLPTDHGVALQDSNYKRHKNAFTFFRHNNTEEVFLADNESEMNDWLSKLNHQAAFKTAGIRPRGLLGGHYDGQRQRALRRLDSTGTSPHAQTVQTPTGEVTIQRGKIDDNLAQQITSARQETMRKKIDEAEEKLTTVIRQIDAQLRDARHLLVLAPIQPKTREQLVHAAGRMSAKMKWVRIEMWRMKCHRDILALDLEDERKEAVRRRTRMSLVEGKANSMLSAMSSTTAATTSAGTADRPPSVANTPASTLKTLRSSSPPPRSDTQASLTSVIDGEDDVFRTPPENSPTFAPGTNGRHLDDIVVKPNRMSMSHRTFRKDAPDMLEPPESPASSEYRTPTLDDNEARRQREAVFGAHSDGLGGALEQMFTQPDTSSEAEATDVSEQPLPTPGSPDSRKPRRPMQRTLRDGGSAGSRRDTNSGQYHHHQHHRGKASKGDSISSAAMSEDLSSEKANVNADDQTPTKSTDLKQRPVANEALTNSSESVTQLKREKGSFTVHGKKASVITFGGDWAAMSPEQRLQLRKQAVSTPSTEVYTPSRLTSTGSYGLGSPYLPTNNSSRSAAPTLQKVSSHEVAVVDEEEFDDALENSSSSPVRATARSYHHHHHKPRSSSFASSPPTKERQSSVSSFSSITPTMETLRSPLHQIGNSIEKDSSAEDQKATETKALGENQANGHNLHIHDSDDDDDDEQDNNDQRMPKSTAKNAEHSKRRDSEARTPRNITPDSRERLRTVEASA